MMGTGWIDRCWIDQRPNRPNTQHRYGLPIDVKEARELQDAVEGIKDEVG